MSRDMQFISKKTTLHIENWKYVAYKMLSSIYVNIKCDFFSKYVQLNTMHTHPID